MKGFRLINLALVASSAISAAFAAPTNYTLPDLYEATIAELEAGLDSGAFTSVDLVKAYIARIEEVNYKGPELRVVLEVSPVALEQAAYFDNLRKTTKLGPLHGIPILVKDNIGTQPEDGMNTTAGSYALLKSITPGDSHVVAQLKKSGAIVLGKLNLSEWAFWRSSDGIPSGWTGRGGQCTNPYYPGGNPSGSSAGSGVAAAIGLSAATLGTDTGGSVIYPASSNNVAGLRPTVGLVSRTGVVPLSIHHDTVGPMGRTIMDIAILLDAIAGADPTDNYTVNAFTANGLPSYTAGLSKDALKGVRIGVPRNLEGDTLDVNSVPTGIVSAFDAAIEVIKSLGATIVDPANVSISASSYLSTNFQTVLAADFKVDITNYLGTLKEIPTGVHDLTDLINYNNDHMSLEEPPTYTSQDLWYLSDDTDGRNLSLAYNVTTQGQMNIDSVLEMYNISALIFPAPQSTFSALARYPQVVVPLGFLPNNTEAIPVQNHTVTTYDPFPNMPYALTFAGTGFSEANLLKYAYAFEQATHHRLDKLAYPAAIPKTQLKDVL